MKRCAVALVLLLVVVMGPDREAAAMNGAQQTDPSPYALVVGITGYPSFPPDEKLKYADADAQLFADFLLSPAGGAFPSQQVRLLKNEQATRKQIFDEIRWIGLRAHDEDVVYIFFAGHGIKDEADGNTYFMPYDSDPSNIAAEGIRADELLQEVKRRIKANTIVFFLDACYAGSAAKGARGGATNEIVSSLRNLWAQGATGDALRMGFFSAGPNQVSWEDDTLSHGLFAWYLVKGLQGAADVSPADGVIRAGELSRYLLDNVYSYSKDHFPTVQEPITSPDFNSAFPLASTQAQGIGRLKSSEWQPGPPGTYSFDALAQYFGSAGQILVRSDFEPGSPPLLSLKNTATESIYVDNGRLRYDRRLRDGSFMGYLIGGPDVENFILHTTVNFVDGDPASSPSFAIYLKFQDNQNYYVLAGHMPVHAGEQGRFSLFRFVGGQWLAPIMGQNVTTVAWHRDVNVFVKWYQGHLQVWVDNVPALDVMENSTPRGRVALGAGAYASVTFDNVILAGLQ